MSDMVGMFRDLKEVRKAERKAFGRDCPVCVKLRPKAHAKILLPGQTCRAHKPHFTDERPDITQEQYLAMEIPA